jgi:hypothetical protein
MGRAIRDPLILFLMSGASHCFAPVIPDFQYERLSLLSNKNSTGGNQTIFFCLTTAEISVFMAYRSLNFDAPESSQARLVRPHAGGYVVDCEISRLPMRGTPSVLQCARFDLIWD